MDSEQVCDDNRVEYAGEMINWLTVNVNIDSNFNPIPEEYLRLNSVSKPLMNYRLIFNRSSRNCILETPDVSLPTWGQLGIL